MGSPWCLRMSGASATSKYKKSIFLNLLIIDLKKHEFIKQQSILLDSSEKHFTRDYRPKLYTPENSYGKQVPCYKGLKLTGFKLSEYYASKEEYQAKYSHQKSLENTSNIEDIEDNDHPQTSSESKSDQRGYK